MAAITPPLFLAAGSHTAQSVRSFHGAMFGNRQGIATTGSFLVAQRAAGTNMSVDVAAGKRDREG